MRGLLLSVLFSTLLIAILALVGFNYYSNSTGSTITSANKAGADLNETSDPKSLASDIKTQTDLKNIETSLAVYFSEYGYYPIDLNELKTSGALNSVDVGKVSYTRCDSDTVVVKEGSSGIRVERGQTSSTLGC